MSGPWTSVVFAAGCLLLFVGERVFGHGTSRLALSGAGALAVAAALALRAVRVLRTRGEWRRVEGAAFWPMLLGGVGLGLYALRALVPALAESSPRLSTALSVVWPVLLAFSLLPLLLVELSAASMARAPVVEAGRVMDALRAGLGLASVLVLGFSAMYVATVRDVVADLSYFRTARPGDSTRKMVRALASPLEVTLFFPPGSQVREQAHLYFEELSRESPQLKVSLVDQAVEPRRAKELGVLTNGAVVLATGGRKEQLPLAVELDRARGGLRTLDRDVQKRLWSLTRARRTVYFTTGHGERTERPAEGDVRTGVRAFREVLRAQNLELRALSAADGLAADVPSDAAAVVVLGPSRAFLPEERAALTRYFERGGRLWLALDADAPEEAQALLSPLGLRLGAHPLANEKVFLSRTRQASDRLNLGTVSYASHPAATSLARAGSSAATVFLEARALEEVVPRPAGLAVDPVVRAHAETFNDVDGDLAFDEGGEQRRAWPLVVAVSALRAAGDKTPPGRAVVVGDADALGDVALQVLGNAYLAMDGARWLLGEEAFAGAVESEEDVPVQHTREQDKVWFYGSVFLVPALVVGGGAVVTRRRRTRRGPEVKP